MRILCTFPGKFGDLLWALPTVRAISERAGEPVDVEIAAAFGDIVDLVRAQPYVRACFANPIWQVQMTAPITPRYPPTVIGPFDEIYHLGYEGWPTRPLAEEIAAQAGIAIDLDRPWITPMACEPPASGTRGVVLGWSEEHFELKVGLSVLLAMRFSRQPAVQFWWLRPWEGRYDEIDSQFQQPDTHYAYGPFSPNTTIIRSNWTAAAALMATAGIYVGCLSALWVLANALGLRCLVVEPNPQRHHPVFWRESPKNRLILGGDGQPTFDARHVGDALEEALRA